MAKGGEGQGAERSCYSSYSSRGFQSFSHEGAVTSLKEDLTVRPNETIKPGKLTLNWETERYLGPDALAEVTGGCCTATGHIPCSCTPSNTAMSYGTDESTSVCDTCA